MKKEYKKPQFYTVQLATQQMLALSKGDEYNGEQTLAPGYSRKNNPNGYDEDEEEDEEDW